MGLMQHRDKIKGEGAHNAAGQVPPQAVHLYHPPHALRLRVAAAVRCKLCGPLQAASARAFRTCW